MQINTVHTAAVMTVREAVMMTKISYQCSFSLFEGWITAPVFPPDLVAVD